MANTTNFNWETPDDTDLVKDGALAIRTLGNSIDTTLVDLKGGTTGQVLSKTSNTDMDFTWVTQDDANAIQNAIVDAKGDLITATAADTPARLAVGTNGQVLTADSTTATGLKWASAASFPNSDSAEVTTSQSTTSTSYTDLSTAGPSVTVTTGTKALVIITASIQNNSDGFGATASYAVSGATTISAQDKYAISMRSDGVNSNRHVQKASVGYMIENLTAGSNTFTMKYKTESTSTSTFSDRLITVIDMGS